MDRKEFEVLVARAWDELPKEFKDRLDNVDVVIEDVPDMEKVRLGGLGGRGRLLGLYQGIPLESRTHYYGMVMPDKITLFKGNIELACKVQDLDIYEEVRHVLMHEIAHHFGISDDRLREEGIY